MTSRKRTPDFLKGVAVLFMIQVHLMELFAQQEIYDGLIGKISLFLGGPPAAPIFMAVMGYFLAFSKKSLFPSVLRGIKLIVWGFALNIGLNLNLFYHIYTGTIKIGPLEYLFGVDILFLAGLSVIFIALIKHFFKEKVGVFISILLLVILIPEFFKVPVAVGTMKYVWAYLYSDVWWSYFPLVPWFAYVMVGYIFKLLERNIIVLFGEKRLIVLFSSMVLLVLGFWFGLDVSSNLHEYYHHGIIYFLFSLVFMVFWLISSAQIMHNFNNGFTKYVEWLGNNVTTTYVFQWLIIGNISTIIYKTQTWWELILWFVGILGIVTLLVYGWIKIKNQQKNTKVLVI